MNNTRPLPSAALDRHRGEILSSASRHKVSNVRVFGSVARGQDTRFSDVDLLVPISGNSDAKNLYRGIRETLASTTAAAVPASPVTGPLHRAQ